MQVEEILEFVIEAVTQVQEQSQRDVPKLRGDTHLIGDVPGCDSLVAIELSFVLTDALAPLLDSQLGSREIPDEILRGSGRNARPTLDEIAQDIYEFVYGPESRPPADQSASRPTSRGKPKKSRTSRKNGEAVKGTPLEPEQGGIQSKIALNGSLTPAAGLKPIPPGESR